MRSLPYCPMLVVSLSAFTAAGCSDPDAPDPDEGIAISPAEATFSLDRSVRFTATVHEPSSPAAPVQWTSSAPAVASVSETGVVTALTEGRATIIATSGAARGRAAVRVTATRALSFFAQKYCAVRSDAKIFCDNPEAFRPGPGVPVPANVEFVDVRTGNDHACALTAAGVTYCWGSNALQQLGVPNVTATDSALRVATTERFRALSAGYLYSCGLNTTGRAFCWGSDLQGNGTGGPAPTPRPVVTDQRFTRIATGLYRTCGLTTGGDVHCWGDFPDLIDAPGLHFRALDVAVLLQCGITTTNVVLCGDEKWLQTPTSNLSATLASVFTSGWDTTCGLTADGTAYCWGNNYWGQLGNGETTSFEVVTPATPVVGGLHFRSLHLGRTFTCGLTLDGRTYCWGADFPGTPPDDAPNASTRPVRVFLAP